MASGSHDPAALQEFRTALATRDPKTVATYLTTMRDFVAWLAMQPGGAPFHLGLVTETAVRGYMDWLQSAGRAPRTRSKALSGLRRFCQWAVDEGYLRCNPARLMERPTVVAMAPTELSEKQRFVLQQLVERHATHRVAAIFALGYWAGLRISEIAALRVDQCYINQRAGSITLIDAKGGKTRTLDLHNMARRALYDYLFPTRPQDRERDEESVYVFTSQRAAWLRQQGRPDHLSERGIEHLWMQVKQQGTQEEWERIAGVTFHDLRHDFAHRARAAGWSLEELAVYAGHQTKWAAVMSYGRTAQLLEEVLPLEKRISTAALSQHVQQVATRVDGELGDKQCSFIEGCPQEWEQLPEPAESLVVGIDGVYIHAREDQNRKAGSFEIIVGKSMTREQPFKRFGFVNDYDTKSKRRVYEVLTSQGMQMNQQVIFLSDGGDDVRNLQLYLNPQAEYVLDWFHVTMRLTVLGQLAKGVALRTEPKKIKKKHRPFEEEEPSPSIPTLEELEHQLERIKWYLWHGNAFRALQIGEDLEEDLDLPEEKNGSIQKLLQAMREFNGYITANEHYIVNYGDRYRNGETISTAFVESTVNEVISKRFVKKQQMRWTKEGAHRLLQVRIQVLNDELQQTFRNWYPGMCETPLATENDRAA